MTTPAYPAPVGSQTAFDPLWLIDGLNAAVLVGSHLPEDLIRTMAKRLRWWLHAHAFIQDLLGDRCREKSLTCPKLIREEYLAVRRELRSGKLKYPLLPKAREGGRPRAGEAAYLRAKLLAPYYEVEDNSEALHRELSRNGHFLVSCGFPENTVPAVRTLQRYEYVAQEFGLWARLMKRLTLRTFQAHLWSGKHLAIDPTHATDYAQVRKQTKASKDCGCERCKAEPELTCNQTDVVAKSANYKMPGVKTGIITDAESELPIGGLTFNARKHDGTMGERLIKEVTRLHPWLSPQQFSLDRAFDAVIIRQRMQAVFPEATFFIAPNQRRRKPIVVNDPFITEISPLGVPQCRKGDMEFAARDATNQRYIFRCPAYDPKTGKTDCPVANECRGAGKKARYFTVPRKVLSFVDWENPHFTKSFKKAYDKRTSTERVNGRMKWVLPFERVWGRGELRIQAHWDKMVIAFHLFALVMHDVGADDRIRSIAHPFI